MGIFIFDLYFYLCNIGLLSMLDIKNAGFNGCGRNILRLLSSPNDKIGPFFESIPKQILS